MSQVNLLVDPEYCTGCHSCEVACKAQNNLPGGYNWINVCQIGPREIGGKLKTEYIPVRCRHCAQPPCIDSCPVKAITKESSGRVVINQEICIGCMNCVEACPFGAVAFDSQTKTASVCDLCLDTLVAAGQEPACVQACPSKCIYFGDINEISGILRKKAANRIAGY